MPHGEFSVEIDRTPDEVFRFVEDSSNDPIWRRGMSDSRQTSEGPRGVGTTGEEVYRIAGRESPSTWTITEYDPGRRVEYVSTSGPFEYRGVWRYAAKGPGMHLTVSIDWSTSDPEALGGLSEHALMRTWQAVTEKELEVLKRLLEA